MAILPPATPYTHTTLHRVATMRRYSSRLISLLLMTLIFAALAPSIPLSQEGIMPGGMSKVGQSFSTASQAANVSLTGAYFDHVVLIMMENRALTDICGSKLPPPCNGNLTSNKPATPFMAGLANSYTLGTQYVSVINTSLPNYVALIGGSTFGCGSGGCGKLGAITARNLVDRLETSDLSWKAYFENYTGSSGCFGSSPGSYNYLHNPFIWFNDINSNSTRCAKLVSANPSSCARIDCTLISDLNGVSPPGFAWLTPNECDNMHGNGVCTNNNCLGTSSIYRTACISAGESYLKTLVPNILNSTVFKSQRSVLFITFDEGTGNCPSPNPTNEDCVYAVWAGPVTKKNNPPSNNLYNHYSFLKTLEFNWNLAGLGTNDTTAFAMKDFFSPTFPLSPSPTSLTVSAGSSITSTLTLSSLSGLNGTVNLTALANPSGPGLTLNPTDVVLKNQQTNSSILSFSSALIGNYTVTVTGVSGNLSRSAILTVRVVDFKISSAVTSIVSPAGSNVSSTVTLTGINGYSGNISLTVTVQNASTIVGTGGSGRRPLEMLPPSDPALPNASLNPASLLITNGDSVQSLLTIIIPSGTPSGNYNLSIQAASGSLVHAIAITVIVSTASVGGLIISIDKLGLSIQLLPTGTSILIVLASALAIVGTARKRSKRRIPSHNLRKAEGVREWRRSTTVVHSTTIGPFWKPARQLERW
jgi:hypothetical protein